MSTRIKLIYFLAVKFQELQRLQVKIQPDPLDIKCNTVAVKIYTKRFNDLKSLITLCIQDIKEIPKESNDECIQYRLEVTKAIANKKMSLLNLNVKVFAAHTDVERAVLHNGITMLEEQIHNEKIILSLL